MSQAIGERHFYTQDELDELHDIYLRLSKNNKYKQRSSLMQYRNQCPKCNSQHLNRCCMHPHGGNQLERTVVCYECGNAWTEIYDTVLVEIKDKQETT